MTTVVVSRPGDTEVYGLEWYDSGRRILHIRNLHLTLEDPSPDDWKTMTVIDLKCEWVYYSVKFSGWVTIFKGDDNASEHTQDEE